MIRVAILGATGYSALELIKILLRHPDVEITCATSRQEGNPPIASVHPSLTGRLNLQLEDPGPEVVASRADVVFGCLPHGVTAAIVPQLLASGKTKVIDLSADYRLKNPETYATWYGHKHADLAGLAAAEYGLPELFRERIRSTRLVANPGCYPTSAILPLAPLLKQGIIKPEGIIIDSKSGVSGAGRTLTLTTHFPECNESVSAYNLGRHRHMPEIEQVLTTAGGHDISLIFTPHLIPMDRGILSTTYSLPTQPIAEERLLDVLREFYANEPFVRVVDHLPGTKDTAGTNFCHLTARVVRDRIITVSVIDNLIKGAAGAAVQNMNLLFGVEETTALLNL
jgi:N-acetyl-gamma-glutamyl-phosphate reductase